MLRVRIIAPLEFRLAMVRDRLGLSREGGLAYIARMDEERRKWTHFLYGVEWDDPSLYDVVINLAHATIAEACAVLSDMARLDCFAFTPERRAAIQDFALASKVWAALGLDPGTTYAAAGRIGRRAPLAWFCARPGYRWWVVGGGHGLPGRLHPAQ